jgi:hypothetical protein
MGGVQLLGEIAFVFDGREATKHAIDARQMGKSLIGLDRAVNVSLSLAVNGRLPRRNERFGLYLAAKAPARGSLDLPTVIENAPWILPLMHEALATLGTEYIRNFISWLLLWHGGRKADAEIHMEKMLDLVREMNRHNEAQTASWQQTVLALVDKLAPTAREIVEPVGRSASLLSVGGAKVDGVATVDEATADAIRSKDEIELQENTEFTLRLDGIIRHSRVIKAEFLDAPGEYVTADVRDPEFDVVPNSYTEALGSGNPIVVRARPALRSGQLFKLYVMEVVKVVPSAAA